MLRLVKTTDRLTATATSERRKSGKQTAALSTECAKNADPQVIAALEKLLAKARTGEVTGLMYVVRMNNRDHGVGVVGHYVNDTQAGLSAFAMVYGLLGESLSSSQC